jgi:hypothetical protein
VYSGQGAERTALCPAQGIEAESPDDDRREAEDLQQKARPPRRAGVAPKCVAGNTAVYCFTCVGPGLCSNPGNFVKKIAKKIFSPSFKFWIPFKYLLLIFWKVFTLLLLTV